MIGGGGGMWFLHTTVGCRKLVDFTLYGRSVAGLKLGKVLESFDTATLVDFR